MADGADFERFKKNLKIFMPENYQFSAFPPQFYFCQSGKASQTVPSRHKNCLMTKFFRELSAL